MIRKPQKRDKEIVNVTWGIAFFYGQGVEEDKVIANQWYEKSAKQGNVNAQFNLGLSFYEGEGVEKDYAKAMHWFNKAAEFGDEGAKGVLSKLL